MTRFPDKYRATYHGPRDEDLIEVHEFDSFEEALVHVVLEQRMYLADNDSREVIFTVMDGSSSEEVLLWSMPGHGDWSIYQVSTVPNGEATYPVTSPRSMHR